MTQQNQHLRRKHGKNFYEEKREKYRTEVAATTIRQARLAAVRYLLAMEASQCFVSLQEHIFLSSQADLQIHAYRKSDGQLVKSYTVDATPHHLVISGQVEDPHTGELLM